mgnify:FL=1
MIRGLEVEDDQGGRLLRDQLSLLPAQRDVLAMVTALRGSGVEDEAEAEVLRLEQEAERCLQAIDPTGVKVQDLRALMEVLRSRKA